MKKLNIAGLIMALSAFCISGFAGNPTVQPSTTSTMRASAVLTTSNVRVTTSVRVRGSMDAIALIASGGPGSGGNITVTPQSSVDGTNWSTLASAYTWSGGFTDTTGSQVIVIPTNQIPGAYLSALVKIASSGTNSSLQVDWADIKFAQEP